MPLPKTPEQIAHCAQCVMMDDPDKPLCSGFMRPEGQGVNKVLVVAEALGKHEHDEGLPLRPQAAAGSVFQRALDKLGVSRESFIIANMVWGQPKLNKLEGEWYEQQAINHCSKYLKGAIERYNPGAILALGNIPLKYLTGNTGKDRTIGSLRGYVFPGIGVANSIPVISSYHPSFLARGGGAEKLLGVLIHDIGRAVHVAKGTPVKGEWLNIEGVELPDLPQLEYMHNPLDSWIANWLETVSQNPNLSIGIDIETDYTKKGAKNESEQHVAQMYTLGADGKLHYIGGNKITQIQFSFRKGEALILPWAHSYYEVIKRILALPNPKLGHNLWRFDLPRLRAEGMVINGDLHDTMVAWHILQPDLPADLQFVASMHYFPFPWKHLGVESPVYGGADVDSLVYIWDRLPTAMKNRGVWQAYLDYFKGEFQDTLDGMQRRGIYIDTRERERFKVEVEAEKVRLYEKIQFEVPVEVKPINPPSGYKVWPPTARQLRDEVLATYAVKKVEELDEGAYARLRTRIWEAMGPSIAWKEFGGVLRPYEQLPFLAQSTAHLKNLIKHYGAKVPKNLDDDETTARPELEKLIGSLRKKSNELLEKAANPKARKAEEFATKARGWFKLAEIIEDCILYRQYNKIAATYIDGWKLDDDHLVHTTYTHRSASWQLTSVEPNVQNIPKHGKLAKPFLKMLTSRPGHTLVNFDMKACHMLTMAFEAQDKDYERIARIDGHSFLAAHILKMPECKKLITLSDGELREYFKWFKSDQARLDIRNKKAKPTLLGWQLGLGVTKLYDMNIESFASKNEAKEVKKLLESLFPKVTQWQKYIKKLAAKQGFLQSRYGGVRWFWSMVRWNANEQDWELGDDGEAALAFLIQQHAFGKMREAMLDLHERNWDELYWLNNTVHDSLEFDCPDELVGECIEHVYWAMTLPAKKLVHPTLWPEGLRFDVEIHTGKNKAPWHEVDNISGMKEVKP